MVSLGTKYCDPNSAVGNKLPLKNNNTNFGQFWFLLRLFEAQSTDCSYMPIDFLGHVRKLYIYVN